MRAAVHDRYGGPDVVSIRTMDPPCPGTGDLLVKVHATTVTTADWRLRAAAFPGILRLPGRLMTGVLAPRKRILGGEFAGVVAKIGGDVTGFAPGDRVFGFSGHGAHAELVAIAAEGPVLHIPAHLDHEEAAAVPFGALTALVFLRDFAKLKAGERVLVVGGSGGVGVFAVQLAKHFGASVDAVAGASNADLVRSLGASRAFDHAAEDFAQSRETWDVILDTVGKTSFPACRNALRPGGRHVHLEFGLTEMMQALVTALGGDRKVVIGVSGDTKEDLAFIADLLARGAIRPVIDSRHPLQRIAEAHARVETRHKRGSVVVTVP